MAMSNKAFAELAEEDEQTRGDVKHEAWSRTIDKWQEERPEDFQRMEESDYFSWEDMGVEWSKDENGRLYLKAKTGIIYRPGDPLGKERYELGYDFVSDYRSEIARIVSNGIESIYPTA